MTRSGGRGADPEVQAKLDETVSMHAPVALAASNLAPTSAELRVHDGSNAFWSVREAQHPQQVDDGGHKEGATLHDSVVAMPRVLDHD